MIPRALRSPVMAMARPARPREETAAVREAADAVRAETGLTAADPVASIIARRVVEAARAYLDEEMDPFVAALKEAQRRLEGCPFDTLATDATIDTLGLFVAARVQRLQARQGRMIPSQDDEAECGELWAGVQKTLWRRYLKALR
ncbi:hypothetical protein KY084_04025 [Stakelama sp. CBK3Z-3]|uniref:Uncharacterized protein n=1 Tax=Stakelama flava TaxID=2860338 RepID=A0ABS6XIM1_9SPHN|nr:hypothetical protein [Stakelama flava]MBW4330040.1 hypothetical protein [Stakelama flava]